MIEYSFQPFLDALGEDWYADDALLATLLAAHGADPEAQGLHRWGGRCAGPLRELAEASARDHDGPRLRPYDAFGERIDEVVLPPSTLAALAEVEGREKLGALHGDPFAFYARIYLYAQNGEAGVACSAACTDGLVRALEALGEREVHREAAARVRGSTPERVWHGAQFVTEAQGGSDVPANRTLAVADGSAGTYRLHGRKWFCSNVNADYWLVTARPEAEGRGSGVPVGLFLVPARRSGVRNGHTIDRLKEKLGTRELATAEVTFRGAVAWPVGPPERGLPNLLRHVLVPSRLACVLFAASALRRAERVAGAYTDFRTAFGRRIADFPLVRESLREIREARAGALACAFGLLALWPDLEGAAGARPGSGRAPGQGGGQGTAGAESGDSAKLFRILLSLCKPVLTRDATRLLHEAILLLGGNGIEERFSPLPRIYRDAAIMETWEGPHNVLLTQALRDLRRFEVGAEEFVHRVAGEFRTDLVPELDAALQTADEAEGAVILGRLAAPLVRAWSRRLLAEAGAETAAGR